MSDPVFCLEGEFEVRTGLGCLWRRDGPEVALRPKTFQTLVYLITNRHRLVTKEELANHLWFDTAVTDDALVQCIVELRKALGDAAREPRFIKTVPKLGYRFIGDVTEIAADPPPLMEAAREVQTASELQGPVARHWELMPIGIAVSAIAVIAAVMLLNSGTRTETAALDPTSGKPGIAVMFLDNQSRSADIDWMRQGLAEMLITGLSRSDRVNVLGRKHLQTLLDRLHHDPHQEIPVTVARDVARRAQATHLLTGSFARLGDKTRIDVRIETLDARPVASETLTVDRPDEVLTQVDLLAWKLARHFDTGVTRPDATPAGGLTSDLDAYRSYSLGLTMAISYRTEEAIKLFERALELDPHFVMARARLGYVYGVTWELPGQALPYLQAAFAEADRLRESDRLYIQAWHAIALRDYPAAIEPLKKLIRLYPYEVEAYDRLARLLTGERRFEDALDVARRGLLIDPESTTLQNTLGGTYTYLGRLADGIAAQRRYVALVPNEPNSHDSLGLALQVAGRYDEAEAAYERALTLKPDFELSLAHLANVHFQTGRYRSAEQIYKRYHLLVRSAGERGRALNAIAIIRARRGQRVEAAEAARLADVESRSFGGPDEPAWSSLYLAAEFKQPSPQQLPVERLHAYSARGARHSRRGFLWLHAHGMLRSGRVVDAMDSFRRSLVENHIYWSLDPFEDGLALAHLELGDADEAIAELGRVLQSNPRYPRAHYHLALAYEVKGDRAAARKALTEFLRLWHGADADAPEIIDAHQRLAKLQS